MSGKTTSFFFEFFSRFFLFGGGGGGGGISKKGRGKQTHRYRAVGRPAIEHCTLSAPLGYISTTRHCGDEHTSWAMSCCCWLAVEAEPEGDEGPQPPALLPRRRS